jgi:hypothetical protein
MSRVNGMSSMSRMGFISQPSNRVARRINDAIDTDVRLTNVVEYDEIKQGFEGNEGIGYQETKQIEIDNRKIEETETQIINIENEMNIQVQERKKIEGLIREGDGFIKKAENSIEILSKSGQDKNRLTKKEEELVKFRASNILLENRLKDINNKNRKSNMQYETLLRLKKHLQNLNTTYNPKFKGWGGGIKRKVVKHKVIPTKASRPVKPTVRKPTKRPTKPTASKPTKPTKRPVKPTKPTARKPTIVRRK